MKKHQITTKAKAIRVSPHIHLGIRRDVLGVVTKQDKTEGRLEAMLRSINTTAQHSHISRGTQDFN